MPMLDVNSLYQSGVVLHVDRICFQFDEKKNRPSLHRCTINRLSRNDEGGGGLGAHIWMTSWLNSPEAVTLWASAAEQHLHSSQAGGWQQVRATSYPYPARTQSARHLAQELHYSDRKQAQSGQRQASPNHARYALGFDWSIAADCLMTSEADSSGYWVRRTPWRHESRFTIYITKLHNARVSETRLSNSKLSLSCKLRRITNSIGERFKSLST